MLQQGARPQRRHVGADPYAPLPAASYGQAETKSALPSEAFQYEIVYDAFQADEDFWRHWKVVDCARSTAEQSVRQGSATIRVVLDLPASQRLFPTVYTPGFPTLPFGYGQAAAMSHLGAMKWVMKDTLPEEEGEDMDPDDADIRDIEDMKTWCQENAACIGFAYNASTGAWRPKRADTGFHPRTAVWTEPGLLGSFWHFYYLKDRAEEQGRKTNTISGLPPGYSVALEVHILEEARILLAHQRSFRGGKIDPQYEWLDTIVRKVDGDLVKPNPRAKRAARKTPAHATDRGGHPEADLRPPVGSLPLDCSEPGLSEDLKAYSDLYGDGQVTKHVGQGRNQVYAENTLINAFGNDLRLPKRESGPWEGPQKKSLAELQQEAREGQLLDQELEHLLHRSDANRRGGQGGGGLLAGRLDR